MESNTETHDVESHSTRDETPSRDSTTLINQGETENVSRVAETLISEACSNSIEDRHSTSCIHQAVENVGDLTQTVLTTLDCPVENNTKTHDVESHSTKSSIISKEAKRTKLSSGGWHAQRRKVGIEPERT